MPSNKPCARSSLIEQNLLCDPLKKEKGKRKKEEGGKGDMRLLLSVSLATFG